MKLPISRASDTLDRYRAAESLPAGAKSRLLRGLESQIAAGAVPPPGVDVAPPAGLGGSASSGLFGIGAKIGIGILVAAVPAWLLTRSPTVARTEAPAPPAAHHAATTPVVEPVEPASAPPAVAPAAPAEAAQPAAAPAPAEAPAAAVTGPEGKPGAARPRAPTPRPPVAAAAAPPKAAPAEASPTPVTLEESSDPAQPVEAAQTIDEEVALLGKAQTAIRSGKSGEALRLLAEHARRFPRSELADAREVARIIALCNSGEKKAARAAADRFLAGRPGSPLASRVRGVCADHPSE